MLDYNSTFNPPSPYTQQQRSEALAGLHMDHPYKQYGRNQQDILDSLEGQNAAQIGMQATKANADYDLQRNQAEQQLALAGLTQLSAAQQNQAQLANQRFGNMTSMLSPLLSNLF